MSANEKAAAPKNGAAAEKKMWSANKQAGFAGLVRIRNFGNQIPNLSISS